MTTSDTSDPKPYWLKNDDGPKTLVESTIFRELAAANQTGGEFGLVEMSGSKGTGPPAHSHGIEAEAFYILEGRVRVWDGEIDEVGGPGDFFYIPKKTRHKYRIESPTARFLCIITPGGFEEFFREIGEPTEGPYPPNPEHFLPLRIDKMMEIADKYHWSPAEEFPD